MFSVRISFISAYPFLPFHFSFLVPFTFLSFLRPFLTHLFSSRLPFSSSPISFHSSCPPLPFFLFSPTFPHFHVLPISSPRTVALPFCNFGKIGSCKLYYNDVLQKKAKSIFCKLSAIQGGFYAANGRWGARLSDEPPGSATVPDCSELQPLYRAHLLRQLARIGRSFSDRTLHTSCFGFLRASRDIEYRESVFNRNLSRSRSTLPVISDVGARVRYSICRLLSVWNFDPANAGKQVVGPEGLHRTC